MPDKTTDSGVPANDGIYGFVPDEVYHGDRGSLSVSGAKLLLPPSCPAKFRHQQDNPPKPKREWDFGHLAHRLILGKGADIAVLDPAVHGLKRDGSPADNPRATAGWKAAEAEARDKCQVPVHVDDYRRAEAIAEAVLKDPTCGPWFADGLAEHAAYRVDPLTGVRLRGRADWITGDLIVDVKTSVTANPSELERTFWRLGYFMQNAWYEDLFGAVTGETFGFRFVVVEKEPPHLVTPVRYTADAINEGRRRNRIAVDLYAECMERDEWPAYTDSTVSLALPRWAAFDTTDETTYAEVDHVTLNDLIEID